MTIELQSRPSLPAPAGAPPRAGTGLPPGFRFYPTDEELIVHYLRRRAAAAPCPAAVIAEVDIYKLDPWELPSRAVFEGDNDEWYFFSPRDRKYPNGVRPNRAAGSGYWKATGTDKPITAGGVPGGEVVGVKKALVFYQGRPPKGLKTNWIMHEYRLADAHAAAVAHTYRPPTRFKASSSMRVRMHVSLQLCFGNRSRYSVTARLPRLSLPHDKHSYRAKNPDFFEIFEFKRSPCS